MASVSRKILAALTVFVAAACTTSVSVAAQEKPAERSAERSGERSGDAKSAPQTTAAPDSITEGSVTTNGISFVEPLKFDDNDIRIEYTGKVNGDEIQFRRQVGDFGSEDFTAKRIKTTTVISDMRTATTADTNSPPAKP